MRKTLHYKNETNNNKKKNHENNYLLGDMKMLSDNYIIAHPSAI
jgi:hypothetical protein